MLMMTETDTMTMEEWIDGVYKAFPSEDVLDPVNHDEFDQLSDAEKDEVAQELSDREREWLFRESVTSKITPAEALDYYMVEFGGYLPSEWAELRDRGTESVRKNRRQAEDKLNKLRMVEGVDFLAPDE